jgi:hypothetical protein
MKRQNLEIKRKTAKESLVAVMRSLIAELAKQRHPVLDSDPAG